MKKAFLLPILLLSGCATNALPPTANVSSNTNTATVVRNDNSSLISASHKSQPAHGSPATANNQTPNSNSSNAGRSPMEQTIDTSEMDAAIEKAVKNLGQKPTDVAAKAALAEAYFVRATALTEAAQYRAALGDYRRGLKLDPANSEAREMQNKIIDIFQMLKREPPKEGEEPAPLPYKKA